MSTNTNNNILSAGEGNATHYTANRTIMYYMYMNELQTTEEQLTAEEIKFCNLVAKGMSGVTAYRLAFPVKKSLAYSTVRQYASNLLTKSNIVTEVATTKERQARLARLAEERIEEVLVDDQIGYKGSKVADVAMFMYDHANGKAVNKVQHTGVFVNVSYDLSGTNEEVPQEIIDQLEDD